ncbi:phytanoyl-CoA dioxygenase [Aspergillus karnatakaensis]|uniref:phytanoyl-CoA dioxygenase family protein n=1 Tax=Aspergillus karnatakaensis TaxID=1810916 RepID=UPI003CCE2FDE
MAPSKQYGPGLQYVPASSNIEDITYLLKRDGGVVLRNFVSQQDLDQTYAEIKDKLDQDVEWEGEFFPKETKRVNHTVAISPTYTKTQVMNPVFQAICAELLTTRSTFWWGDKRKESVSKPYLTSCTAIEIGPGGKAQPLHGDSYVNHRVVSEVAEWDDERDRTRETSIGMMVAGCKATKKNGGTQFIPGSHLWSTDRETPPPLDQVVVPELERGDAFIMFSSVFHGGGTNATTDQRRLVYSTFVVRGYLRQEENMYLAVPQDIVKQYDRATQQFIGYYISDPACGIVEQMDPIYVLYPELRKDAKPNDF